MQLIGPSIRRTGVIAATALLLATSGIGSAATTDSPFEARSTDEALARLGASNPVQSSDIELKAPRLAENGASVSLEVTSKLPNTEYIALLLDGNPNPLAAIVTVRGTEPSVLSYVKLSQPSQVRALVKADGKFYTTSQYVKVVEGGCGGGAPSVLVDNQDRAIGATRIKQRMQGGSADVQVRIQHPMETGMRRKDSGEFVPALDAKTRKPITPHFVNEVSASVNGKTVLEARWGASIAANPLLRFRLKGTKPGDQLDVRWIDNQGRRGGTTAAVS